MIKKEIRYFLVLMWIENGNTDNYKNVNTVGFFDSKESAEKCLMKWWHSLHEHWCNTAVIEAAKEGWTAPMREQYWYQTKDSLTEIPTPIETPKQCKSIIGWWK